MKKNVLPNIVFFTQVEQLIAEGESVRIHLQGHSMRPFIPNGFSVVLHPCPPEKILPGAVVLFRHQHSHILHRVIQRKGNQLLLQGDGNYRKWEKADLNDVVAIVRTVISPTGRCWSTHSYGWRMCSYCWVKLHPLRRYLLAAYNRLLR